MDKDDLQPRAKLRSSLKRVSKKFVLDDNQDTGTFQLARRVSFASTSVVKPYVADPQKNTIWDSSYQEETKIHSKDNALADLEDTKSGQTVIDDVSMELTCQTLQRPRERRNSNVTLCSSVDMSFTCQSLQNLIYPGKESTDQQSERGQTEVENPNRTLRQPAEMSFTCQFLGNPIYDKENMPRAYNEFDATNQLDEVMGLQQSMENQIPITTPRQSEVGSLLSLKNTENSLAPTVSMNTQQLLEAASFIANETSILPQLQPEVGSSLYLKDAESSWAPTVSMRTEQLQEAATSIANDTPPLAHHSNIGLQEAIENETSIVPQLQPEVESSLYLKDAESSLAPTVSMRTQQLLEAAASIANETPPLAHHSNIGLQEAIEKETSIVPQLQPEVESSLYPKDAESSWAPTVSMRTEQLLEAAISIANETPPIEQLAQSAQLLNVESQEDAENSIPFATVPQPDVKSLKNVQSSASMRTEPLPEAGTFIANETSPIEQLSESIQLDDVQEDAQNTTPIATVPQPEAKRPLSFVSRNTQQFPKATTFTAKQTPCAQLLNSLKDYVRNNVGPIDPRTAELERKSAEFHEEVQKYSKVQKEVISFYDSVKVRDFSAHVPEPIANRSITDSNNSGDSVVQEPEPEPEPLHKQLENALRDVDENEIHLMRRKGDHCYIFSCFGRLVQFAVELHREDDRVTDVKCLINLRFKKAGLLSELYGFIARQIQMKLALPKLRSAFGTSFDLLSLKDHVIILVDSGVEFIRDFLRLRRDFRSLRITNTGTVTLNFMYFPPWTWWTIQFDLATTEAIQLDSLKITPHSGTVNSEEIESILRSIEPGVGCIEKFTRTVWKYFNRVVIMREQFKWSRRLNNVPWE